MSAWHTGRSYICLGALGSHVCIGILEVMYVYIIWCIGRSCHLGVLSGRASIGRGGGRGYHGALGGHVSIGRGGGRGYHGALGGHVSIGRGGGRGYHGALGGHVSIGRGGGRG